MKRIAINAGGFGSRCGLLALLVAGSGLTAEAAKKPGNGQMKAQMKAQRRQQMQEQMQEQMQKQAKKQAQKQRARNNASGNANKANREANKAERPPEGPPRRQVLAVAADAPPLQQSAAQVSEAARKIDALVLERLNEAHQQPNALSSDEQFLRRVYLDVAGRIPTADEATAFIASSAPDKRAALIDALLLSQDYRSQSFNWLADMLRVKDRINKGGPTYTYQEWLKERIVQNAPWNDTVYKMLVAQGRLVNDGAAGYLLRDPGMPLDNLSTTLTTFLGANVACAQCHDHPLAPWTQKQFYEMAAFFGDVETKAQKGNAIARKIIRQSPEFSESDRKMLAALASINAAAIQVQPKKQLTFPKDYKYDNARPGQLVHPALFTWQDSDKNSPAYTTNPSVTGGTNLQKRREAFATWLSHPDNPRFAVTIANRLWQKNFGLALQEPIGDLDDLSRGANPQLLVHLAAEMKRLNFDLREFQRVLYNSKTYQRQASVTPDLAKGPYLFPGPVLRRMTAEQAWDSILTLLAGSSLNYYQLKRVDAIKPLIIPGAEFDVKALAAKAKSLGPQALKHAGPNALYYESIDGKTTAAPRFGELMLARASELEQPSKESHFLRMFGQSDREVADDSSREGGIPQVLMLMNGNVQNVIGHKDALALKSAALLPTREKQIESLYLSFLGRMPTAAEKAKVLSAMNQGMQLPELTWVLFNTREFIFVQ